ncbi:small ribosomal subunit protein mS34 isoform X2 [Cherax quadricarinatus]|uniref:small ribosomal subunit protein mS34 isoform X2 n=1 Tax=Cherax quadricarinatus TaxID=27406 RepID=UPI00387E9B71
MSAKIIHELQLWEIVGLLKDFGVGRMVVRSRFERYPEPTFYRIVSAQPEMDNGDPHKDEDNMRGKILVERVFRGKNCGVANISKAAYKTDFRLIHKHEEAKYLEAYQRCVNTSRERKIFPRTMEMPPLLKFVAKREGHASDVLQIKMANKNNNSRVAEEGEEPNVEVSIGLTTPHSPQLYEGVF